jgi:AcrR family transcriptional regulator
MTNDVRGRPRIRQDDEILVAALHMFAAHGYDGMSVRALNIELGLSHGTVNQRFQSKGHLFRAAIDHGFATFLADIAEERARRPPTTDELDDLYENLRAFLHATIRRPELGRLMNQEGLHHSDRLEYIVSTVLEPGFGPLAASIQRLVSADRILPVTTRALFFLVAHGAEAPFTLTALSAAFDRDDGPLDPAAHADAMAALLIRAITI